MITENWLIPSNYQLDPTAIQARQLDQLCVILTTDGSSSGFVLTHKFGISATDLAAGWPHIEIIDVKTFPLPVTTGATVTTLTGKAALLGVTVTSSLSGTLTLAFSNPSVICSFMVLLTRNPSTVTPAL